MDSRKDIAETRECGGREMYVWVKCMIWKREERLAERLRHVMRMSNKSLKKAIIFAWHQGLKKKRRVKIFLRHQRVNEKKDQDRMEKAKDGFALEDDVKRVD